MSGTEMPARKHALIVDDDPAFRQRLRIGLEQIGLVVDEASSVSTGAARFQKVSHAVVVLGARLGQSGTRRTWRNVDEPGLCRVFRRLPGGDRSIVVVLADTHDPERIAWALGQGATEVVPRSTPIGVLQKRLEHMLLCASARAALAVRAAPAPTPSSRALYEAFDARYEPRIDAQSYQVVAFEAHPRCNTTSRTMTPSRDFLTPTERNKFVVGLGEHMLRKACRDVRLLREDTGAPLRVALGVDIQQARDPKFLGRVADALERGEAAPEWLELELPEAALLDADRESTRMLAALREMGVGVTLSDFGCSNTVFETVRRLPLDAIRLTRSLVRDLATHPDGVRILQGITSTAHGCGQRVIAEGIDFEEQLNFLTGLGCNELQGPFVGASLEYGACAAWVRARNLPVGCQPSMLAPPYPTSPPAGAPR